MIGAGIPSVNSTLDHTHHARARASRGEIEDALEQAGWPWVLRLSRWIDALVILEETD